MNQRQRRGDRDERRVRALEGLLLRDVKVAILLITEAQGPDVGAALHQIESQFHGILDRQLGVVVNRAIAFQGQTPALDRLRITQQKQHHKKNKDNTHKQHKQEKNDKPGSVFV